MFDLPTLVLTFIRAFIDTDHFFFLISVCFWLSHPYRLHYLDVFTTCSTVLMLSLSILLLDNIIKLFLQSQTSGIESGWVDLETPTWLFCSDSISGAHISRGQPAACLSSFCVIWFRGCICSCPPSGTVRGWSSLACQIAGCAERHSSVRKG